MIIFAYLDCLLMKQSAGNKIAKAKFKVQPSVESSPVKR